MTTNTRNAVILVGCVTILSSILFYVRFLPEKSSQEGAKIDTQSINMINEHIQNINNIDIVNNYGEYSFVKDISDNDSLIIEDLLSYPKNENAYDELSDKVCNLVADRIVNMSDINPSVYGLEIPQAKVNIKYNDNLEINLLIGNMAPGDAGYYVAQQDKPGVYLVSTDIISVFLKSKIDYISLSVISDTSNNKAMKDLEYLELFGGGRDEKIKITKNKYKNSYIYNIVEPTQKKVSDSGTKTVDSIENIFAQKIEMINVTPEDISDHGLDNPFVSLNLKYKNKEVINILISKVPDSEDFFVFRKDYNIIYRVSKSNLEWADIKVDQLT